MTWLGVLNFLVLQWSGFRLGRVKEGGRHLRWRWIGPVWPLSGWWGAYRYLAPGEAPSASAKARTARAVLSWLFVVGCVANVVAWWDGREWYARALWMAILVLRAVPLLVRNMRRHGRGWVSSRAIEFCEPSFGASAPVGLVSYVFDAESMPFTATRQEPIEMVRAPCECACGCSRITSLWRCMPCKDECEAST